jgi:hypothetical protein
MDTFKRLTPAEAYKLNLEKVRRQAAIDRRTTEAQAYLQQVQELYTQGSPRKTPVEVKPQFAEATTFTVKQLAGGAALSGRKRRPATPAADLDAAAEAKRQKRRERRAARRQQKAAAAQTAN